MTKGKLSKEELKSLVRDRYNQYKNIAQDYQEPVIVVGPCCTDTEEPSDKQNNLCVVG